MKTMTCKQLGGACDVAFTGETFEELSEQAKAHGFEMFQKQDPAHMKAIMDMQQKMQTPEDMAKWMEEKRKEFEAL